MRGAPASALDALLLHIRQDGGDIDVNDLTRGPIPPLMRRAQNGEGEWLRPIEGEVKYRQVWIAYTASRKVAMVLVTSHRRPRGATRRKWYGVDLFSRREVEIRSVLRGSAI